MVVVRSLKDIISIKIKARHDSPCDQFSRLFMTKMLLISSVIMGFDYFSDKVACIIPNKSDLSKDFIHSACWISGFYIYKDMERRPDKSAYYGIPDNILLDGYDRLGKLCTTYRKGVRDFGCRPMQRMYYLQYQWMPFYIGALAILYYVPYIFFRIINVDLISLKSVLKSVTGDADHIVRNYFNYKINSVGRLRARTFMNILVKCGYIIVNFFAFFFTDYLLHGRYRSYGTDYIKWAKKSTPQSHVGIKNRLYGKPGNKLLPSMGYCDINESTKDEVQNIQNSYVFLCEISTNILYQYVLIVLWFLFIISISISILGLFFHLAEHFFNLLLHFGGKSPKQTIYRILTVRETEYLQFIKKKNMVMYGEVLRKLKQQRTDLQGKIAHDGFETSNGFV